MRDPARHALVLGLSFAAAGCYQHHFATRGDAGGADAAGSTVDAASGPRDAGLGGGDAGTDAATARRDAGPPPSLDGWSDPILVFEDGDELHLQRLEHTLVAYEGGFAVFYLVNRDFAGVAGALFDPTGAPVDELFVHPPPERREHETRILAAHADGDRAAVFWHQRDGSTWRRWLMADGHASEARRADTRATTDATLWAFGADGGHRLVWDTEVDGRSVLTVDDLDADLAARGPPANSVPILVGDVAAASSTLIVSGHPLDSSREPIFGRLRPDGSIDAFVRERPSAFTTRGDESWALFDGRPGSELEVFPPRGLAPVGFAGAELVGPRIVWMRDLLAVAFRPHSNSIYYQLVDPDTSSRPEHGEVIATTSPCQLMFHMIAAHADALAVSWTDYCPDVGYRIWLRVRRG